MQLNLLMNLLKIQIEAQVRLAEAFGKKEVREYETAEQNEDLAKKIHDLAYDQMLCNC